MEKNCTSGSAKIAPWRRGGKYPSQVSDTSMWSNPIINQSVLRTELSFFNGVIMNKYMLISVIIVHFLFLKVTFLLLLVKNIFEWVCDVCSLSLSRSLALSLIHWALNPLPWNLLESNGRINNRIVYCVYLVRLSVCRQESIECCC